MFRIAKTDRVIENYQIKMSISLKDRSIKLPLYELGRGGKVVCADIVQSCAGLFAVWQFADGERLGVEKATLDHALRSVAVALDEGTPGLGMTTFKKSLDEARDAIKRFPSAMLETVLVDTNARFAIFYDTERGVMSRWNPQTRQIEATTVDWLSVHIPAFVLLEFLSREIDLLTAERAAKVAQAYYLARRIEIACQE